MGADADVYNACTGVLLHQGLIITEYHYKRSISIHIKVKVIFLYLFLYLFISMTFSIPHFSVI